MLGTGILCCVKRDCSNLMHTKHRCMTLCLMIGLGALVTLTAGISFPGEACFLAKLSLVHSEKSMWNLWGQRGSGFVYHSTTFAERQR
jgi:hypothetical protein